MSEEQTIGNVKEVDKFGGLCPSRKDDHGFNCGSHANVVRSDQIQDMQLLRQGQPSNNGLDRDEREWEE